MTGRLQRLPGSAALPLAAAIAVAAAGAATLMPSNQLYDIALVKLSALVTGVAPAKIWLGDPAGLVGTLTGYGFQDTGLNTGADAHSGELGYYLQGAYSRLAAQNVID